jgi:Tol biopolymer transport system component
MAIQYDVLKKLLNRAGVIIYLSSALVLCAFNNASGGLQNGIDSRLKRIPSPTEEINLSEIPFKILFETYRTTEGKENWEIYRMNADGSEQVNLTRTPDLDEMYPHASPDGTKICFVVDEGTGRNKIRSVYYMNIDGSGRVKVADNARQPCWGPDGQSIAYLRGEYERYSDREYSTAGLFFYDLKTGRRRPHPNNNLLHAYAICWSPDGNWILAVVQGGNRYSDNILAVKVNGTEVYDLSRWGVRGCRPDFSPDGRKMAWGETDWQLCVADINFTSSEPQVFNIHMIVRCSSVAKVYHVDFSPDGKYVAFSYGPFSGKQNVGGRARGWNICISDLSGKWVKITTDGNHNKEPDWMPIAQTIEQTQSPDKDNPNR